jgi:hypothetical protein
MFSAMRQQLLLLLKGMQARYMSHFPRKTCLCAAADAAVEAGETPDWSQQLVGANCSG